jgi:hypothetical protein
VSEQGQKQQPAVVEVVRYASTDLRYPDCQKWRPSLQIYSDGSLWCDGCPAHERHSQPRKKVAA